MARKEKMKDIKPKNHPVRDPKDNQDGSIGAVGSGGAMGLTVGAAAGVAVGGLPGMIAGAALGAAAGALVAEANMETITTHTPLHPQNKKAPVLSDKEH
ncbi:MAG: hypothetical protein ACAH80_02250 [Alphaproteobacteria bacterium]